MKRNHKKVGIALIIGFVLLVTSAFMSLANGQTGYDKFKQVLKDRKVCEFENGTIKLNAMVEDNGKTLVNIDSIAKADKKSDLMSAIVDLKAEGLNKNFELYKTNDGIVLKEKAANQYIKFACQESNCNKMFGKKNQHCFEKTNSNQFSKTHELILDAIVGNYKKNFTEKDLGNGKKEINFTLKENEIPEIVNALLSVKHENINKNSVKKQQAGCNELHKLLGVNEKDIKLPELQSNIKIKNINFNVTLDSKNQINGFGLTLEVKGNDSKAKEHNLKVKVNAQTENLGTTKVDTINLQGKDVKTIKKEDLKMFEGKLNN